MSSDFIFLPVHEIENEKESILTQAMKILNSEWPRSETIRKRALEGSSQHFPMCLVLCQQFSSGIHVLGHAKISKVPSDPESVFVESVIVHPGLRGKGLGKYLMLKTEQYCWNLGIRKVYLTTTDKQLFYSCCGYKFSEPVCAFGGNIKLNFNLQKFASQPPDIVNNDLLKTKNALESEKNNSDNERNSSKSLTNGNSSHAPSSPPPPPPPPCAPPPPPPPSCPPAPPPPMPPPSLPNKNVSNGQENHIEDEELVQKCEKVYSLPKLPERAPLLTEPPPTLENNNNNVVKNKVNKEDILRLSGQQKKMYMKKELDKSHYY